MSDQDKEKQKFTLSKEFIEELEGKVSGLPEEERNAFLRSIVEDEEDWILPQNGPLVFNSKRRASATKRTPETLDLGAFVLGQARQSFQLKAGEVSFTPITGKKRSYLNISTSGDVPTQTALATELALVVVSLNGNPLVPVVDVKGYPVDALVKERREQFLEIPEMIMVDILYHYRFFELLQQRLFEADVMEGFSKPRSDSLGPVSSTTGRTGKL